MPIKVVTSVPSWAQQKGSYYSLKLNINAPRGGLTETYNFNPSLPPPLGNEAIIQTLLKLRGALCAKFTDVVNAVVTQKFPVGSPTINGVRIPQSQYQSPGLINEPMNTLPTVQANFAVTIPAGSVAITSPPVPAGSYPTLADGDYALEIYGGKPTVPATATATIVAGAITVITVSGVGNTGYTSVPTVFLPVPEQATPPSTSPSLGINFTFATNYKPADYLIRCIRESWVTDDQLFTDWLPVFNSNADIAVAAASLSPVTLLGAYLSWIKVNCVLVAKEYALVSPTPTPPISPYSFLWTPFTSFAYTGVSNRKLGEAWPKVAGRKPVLA